MDTRTGRIIILEEFSKLFQQAPSPEELMKAHLKEMDLPPTEKQMARKPPKVGRNEPCPCGSGKKFKHCCYTGK